MAKDKKRDVDAPPEQAAPLPGAAEQQVVLARDLLPASLPVIPIGNRPVFPRMIVPLVIEDERAKNECHAENIIRPPC
jgi:ATP-dependent Lon protease